MNEYQSVAQRQINAVNHFIGLCADLGFNKEEAEHILQVYKKAKVIKLNIAMGRYDFKHGAFFNKEVMQKALDQ